MRRFRDWHDSLTGNQQAIFWYTIIYVPYIVFFTFAVLVL